MIVFERAKDTAGECEECGTTRSNQWHGGAPPQRAAAQGRDAVPRLLHEAGVLPFLH